MSNCKACGEWFSSTHPEDLCPACQRALKRLNGYIEPVRHGRWIDVSIRGIQHYRCTKCGEYIEGTWTANFDYKYCPKCGAKMDLEG